MCVSRRANTLRRFCVLAGISRRVAQWSSDQDDADADADHAPQHRADLLGADERVSVAQSRGRLRTAAGRTVSADPGTNAKHGGAPPPADDHPHREPADATAAAVG